MHSFANFLTKKDQAQKLAFTKPMPCFFVLKLVSSIHYLTVLTTSICFSMFVCSTHWVGYVHNIFKLYTAPYKEKKKPQKKRKTTEKHHFK